MARRIITSTANERVKSLARLRKRSERDATGRFLVEGERELRTAHLAGITIEIVAVCPRLATGSRLALAETIAASGAERLDLAESAFSRVSHRDHPDGILGVGVGWQHGIETIELGDTPIVLVVQGVEKPGNIGAMLRSADAAGADAVVVADPGTDLVNPNVIRASQGAVFTVPVATATTEDVIEWAAANDLALVAGSGDAAETFWDADLGDRVAVVVGAEAAGLDPRWRDRARLVRIPMLGVADSLNVSAAAALLMYEAVRQRAHG